MSSLDTGFCICNPPFQKYKHGEFCIINVLLSLIKFALESKQAIAWTAMLWLIALLMKLSNDAEKLIMSQLLISCVTAWDLQMSNIQI